MMIGSGVMTIYFYQELTRNPEIGNTLVRVLPNIWRLGWVRDIKFDKDDPNELLLNVEKCHGYTFYHFWVIKGKQSFFSIPALGWRWGSGLTGFQPLSHMTLFTCGHLSSYDKLKTLYLFLKIYGQKLSKIGAWRGAPGH